MNVWLLDQCIAYAKNHKHPELRDRTIWELFEEERDQLVPYAGPFDGFHAVPAFFGGAGMYTALPPGKVTTLEPSG